MSLMGAWRQVLIGGTGMTAKKPSQVELYGELLTNEQQYRKDVSMLPCLTEEEQQVLLERACQGEIAARNALVESLLPALLRIAQKYAFAYDWADTRLNGLDLAQDAMLEILVKIEDAPTEIPSVGYLVGIGRMAIRNICYHTAHQECVESLDRPLDKGMTLLDVLEETESEHYSLFPQSVEMVRGKVVLKDHTPLYQVIEGLHDHERVILIRSYGLYDEPVETISEIEKDFPGIAQVRGCKNAVLCKLLSQLALIYPEYVDKEHPHLDRRSPLASRSLTAEQEHRLQQAYQEMEAEGQKITGKALSRRARVDDRVVGTFLHSHRPVVSRQQRLQAVYNELQARGEFISANKLASLAKVEKKAASAYICVQQGKGALLRSSAGSHGMSEEEAQARLQRAYHALLSRHEKVTCQSLTHESGVNNHRVHAFLKSIRAATERETRAS